MVRDESIPNPLLLQTEGVSLLENYFTVECKTLVSVNMALSECENGVQV